MSDSFPRHSRFLGAALLLLGLGAATVALIGPLGAGRLEYHVSPGAAGQARGGDVAGLVLVAPVALLAGILVLRRHRLGPVLALSPAAYGLYMYFQLAVSGDPARYPGNSERFFPLLLGLFILCGWVMLTAVRVPAPVTGRPSRRVDRVVGVYLLLVSAFLVFGLHLPGLLAVWRGDPTAEYLADPGLFWVVKMMDLGVVVPVAVLAGVLLLRAPQRAGLLRYGITGWSALLASSVAGMAVVMQATGDPAGSPVNTVVFGAAAVAAVALAVLVHRPLIISQEEPS